ncbi:hypothetical protein H671_4g12679, partial [Cricetulus griseus]
IKKYVWVKELGTSFAFISTLDAVESFTVPLRPDFRLEIVDLVFVIEQRYRFRKDKRIVCVKY